MDRCQAVQIAALLNAQNQLTVRYSADRVFEHKDNYLVRLNGSGDVIACAELKKVQWYQFELLHVTVAFQYHKQGLARALVSEAENKATAQGGRLLQCTIRAGNLASEMLFKSSSFELASCFYNERSSNIIGVWQKVLSRPPTGN